MPLNIQNTLTRTSNVVAYTMSSNPPRPYRFKSTTLNFQIPGFKNWPGFIQKTKFIQAMSDSDTWKTAMKVLHTLRTWSRKTIWGDRVGSGPTLPKIYAHRGQLFLQFDGPTNILIQTRGPRLNDILTPQQVNEIADTPRGLTTGPKPASGETPTEQEKEGKKVVGDISVAPVPPRTLEEVEMEIEGSAQRIADITRDGKVIFEKPGKAQ